MKFATDTTVTCEWCGKGFATLNGLSGHKPCRLNPAFNQAHAFAMPVPTQPATTAATTTATTTAPVASAVTTMAANTTAASNASTVKPSAIAAAAVLKEAREAKAR